MSGNDGDVIDYLRAGRAEASQDDIRQRVETLVVDSPYENRVRKAGGRGPEG
ncbi:hypothetical protein [Streptomyces clavuligerus]|uniref:hypothetical protein n=1 Tax=Streptomyces clavuligerus TaxID=1901 RepID=UPI001F085674|nr:hypothetical protein [Streptomyces clavuligerus]